MAEKNASENRRKTPNRRTGKERRIGMIPKAMERLGLVRVAVEKRSGGDRRSGLDRRRGFILSLNSEVW